MGLACVWKLKSPIIKDHQLRAILATRRQVRQTIIRFFRRRGGVAFTTPIGGRLSRSDRQMGLACVWKLKSPIIKDHQLLAIVASQRQVWETIIQLFRRRGGAAITTPIGGRLSWSDQRMVRCMCLEIEISHH
jgi:hypothetical protein